MRDAQCKDPDAPDADLLRDEMVVNIGGAMATFLLATRKGKRKS